MVPGPKPKLLLADDDAMLHKMLANLFSQDAEILIATNGCEALESIERHRPDLVILDDAMPEMTGIKVLQRLRATPELSQIPVVMLTASDRPQDIMRADERRAGIYHQAVRSRLAGAKNPRAAEGFARLGREPIS